MKTIPWPCRFIATLRGVEVAERMAMGLADGETLYREGAAAGERGLAYPRRLLPHAHDAASGAARG